MSIVKLSYQKKIFDFKRLFLEQFEILRNLRIMEWWKVFVFTTAYLLLVWPMNLTILDTRGYFEVKSWWYKKLLTVLQIQAYPKKKYFKVNETTDSGES